MMHLDDIEDIITDSTTTTTSPSTSSKNEIPTLEDIIVKNVNTISNIFDYLYFFKSIGFIKEDNILYRNLNKGNWGSKFWSLSLLLSIKKTINKCWKLFKYKLKLKFYIQNFDSIRNQSNHTVNDIILTKLKLKLIKINNLLYDQLFELIQNLIYFIISILDILKNINIFNVPKDKWLKFKNTLETLSNLITIFRFSLNGYNIFKIIH
ncbi:hypothetical protein MOUN0_M00540 [Monosporozyma unispora]|nr:hypothetical protein C6P44_000631 [Kazachstania unispora]